MSQRSRKANYWQDAPMPREQLVLIPTALEEVIADDHPVRLVDEILDELDWTDWEATYHGSKGQPPIHPSIMAKIWLFALIRRLRSSRQIEYELKHSIDFIWLASGRRIDHTTLSEFRRKNSAALRNIFKQMIKLAIDLKVANLAELCIDGTRVLASANRCKTWTTKRLAKALEHLDAQIAEALAGVEINDKNEQNLFGEEVPTDKLPTPVADLQSRREQLAGLMEKTKAMDATRKKNRSKGSAQLPKTDLDSRILPNKEGGYAANYTPMAVTETGSGLIVDCEVVIGNVEHDQFCTIVDAVQSNFEIDIERVLVDSAYTTGANLSSAEAKEIELIGPLAEVKCEDNPAIREDPTVPVAEEDLDRLPINPQTKRFDKSAFVYEESSDCYYCPAGKPLPHRRTVNTTHGCGTPVQRHVYISRDCAGCPLAKRCRTKPDAKRGREVIHDEHEEARRRHRVRMQSEESQSACMRRQHIGERPFAVIKSMFDLRRFLLRGIEGVGQEWRWASTAFNLKKLMSVWGALRSESSEMTASPVI
ncbi:IS1182 family transposase [Aporhodopirellula aestuarii]|uniref:IS1182 family transposase n=1 Tax=Aporhodopirellula aestuarii TaxID=2950107 RepID=A0ABT0UE10_9BACT|nr:IS1182 family transposase [Aporhodopirellula aestuarii]MCM2375267.1 IS1182 family transposase [Aporhodopirellula aestuarii]